MHSVYFIELDGPLQCRFTYDSSSPFCPDAMSPDTIVPLLQDTPQPGSPEHDRTITAGNSPPPRLAEMVSPSCTYPVMDETILLTGRWDQSSVAFTVQSYFRWECTVACFSSSLDTFASQMSVFQVEWGKCWLCNWAPLAILCIPTMHL